MGKGPCEESGLAPSGEKMILPTYKPKRKFMQLAIAEAKRARDRGYYAIGAVSTRLIGKREVVIASAGNRVKTSGSSIKHVELETLKYISSGSSWAKTKGHGRGVRHSPSRFFGVA
jgi:tRNA(Arg) A34 adenosine deaminase TadA